MNTKNSFSSPTISDQGIAPFHLAFPVSDLVATRAFYVNTLGCEEGRSSDHWIDFNLFFLDPSGNALEFKAFKDPSQLFAK